MALSRFLIKLISLGSTTHPAAPTVLGGVSPPVKKVLQEWLLGLNEKISLESWKSFEFVGIVFGCLAVWKI